MRTIIFLEYPPIPIQLGDSFLQFRQGRLEFGDLRIELIVSDQPGVGTVGR